MKKYNEKEADSLNKNLQNDFFCRKPVWHKKLKEQTCRARICFPPLTPDRPQVIRTPPSLPITSNFLVFYGLSHGTTLKKKGLAVF